MKFIPQGLFAFLLVFFSILTVKAEPQRGRMLLTMPPILAAKQTAQTLCESLNRFWYNNECNLTSKQTNKRKTEQLAGQWCDDGTYYFLDINTVTEDIDNPGRYIISGGGIWAYEAEGECSFKDNPYEHYSYYQRFNAVTGWYDTKQNKWFVADHTEQPHCSKTLKLNDVTQSQLKGCVTYAGYFCSSYDCGQVLQRIDPP